MIRVCYAQKLIVLRKRCVLGAVICVLVLKCLACSLDDLEIVITCIVIVIFSSFVMQARVIRIVAIFYFLLVICCVIIWILGVQKRCNLDLVCIEVAFFLCSFQFGKTGDDVSYFYSLLFFA